MSIYIRLAWVLGGKLQINYIPNDIQSTYDAFHVYRLLLHILGLLSLATIKWLIYFFFNLRTSQLFQPVTFCDAFDVSISFMITVVVLIYVNYSSTGTVAKPKHCVRVYSITFLSIFCFAIIYYIKANRLSLSDST